MKKESFNFSELNSTRYLHFLTNNVPQVSNYTVIASSNWELALNITYVALDERLKRHFRIATGRVDANALARTQQYRNHRSTLTGFLASVGKTMESRLGVEFASAFDTSMTKYLEMLTVGDRSKADRRAHLKLIKRLADAPEKAQSEEKLTFSDVLRRAIATTNMPAKTLAKKIGISTSAVQRWLAGAIPNRRGIPTLRRLEQALGLDRDILVSLIIDEIDEPRNTLEIIQTSLSSTPISHRELMVQRKKETCYSLRIDEMSVCFKQEWIELLDYKTTSFPRLERQTSGVWRLIPLDMMSPLPELTNCNGMGCPSASRCLIMFLDFIGTVLRLPRETGGSAISGCVYESVQTLAWLAHPLALKTYIDRLTAKSNGILHSGHKVFCAVVACLLRPRTGYLWQQPNFANRIPSEYRPADEHEWRKMCEESHKMVQAIKAKSTSFSRTPTEPLAFLLELRNPLEPLLDAVKRIDQAAAAAPPGGHRQAQLKRDALLISMLLSNPLRSRTMKSLTWNPRGNGSLRGSPVSGWRIDLSPSQLKNGASAKNRHYNVQVAHWVKSRLDEYIEEHRGTLLRGKPSKYLFVSGRGVGMWNSLGKRVFELTRQYINGSPGFGPHAFRHLVATNWLTAHPNDYLTVAELLNDRLNTVIENYAHLKRDTSFSRYESHLAAML